MAGQWTVSYLSSGLAGGGQVSGSSTLIGASTVGETLLLNLAAGDTTVAVPPGAISVQVVPPSTNASTLKLRTNANSGDGGLPLSATDPFGPFSFRSVSPAVTSIILTAGGTVNGVQVSFL